MPSNIEVPLTTSERFSKHNAKHGDALLNPKSPKWFDRDHNEKLKKELLWATPYDARFPQVRKQRQCFAYYVDFHRCKELMGDSYKPCKFFQNVYQDFCPHFWTEKWDDLVSAGRFPAKFDR